MKTEPSGQTCVSRQASQAVLGKAPWVCKHACRCVCTRLLVCKDAARAVIWAQVPGSLGGRGSRRAGAGGLGWAAAREARPGPQRPIPTVPPAARTHSGCVSTAWGPRVIILTNNNHVAAIYYEMAIITMTAKYSQSADGASRAAKPSPALRQRPRQALLLPSQ